MVRWGSAPSIKQREWDQWPKFSLCQPIASRDRALDIWPCHPVDCRWCISQLGSTLSSMKLWEWLQGEKKKKKKKKVGKQRERRNGGGFLIRCYWSIIDRLSARRQSPKFLYRCRVQLWGNCLLTWVTEVFSQQGYFLCHILDGMVKTKSL